MLKNPGRGVVKLSLSSTRETTKIASLRFYHITFMPDLKDLPKPVSDGTVSTIEKSPLSVRFQDGRIRVNDATLLQADIECSDGIIHVIDIVLIPKP